MHTVLKENTSWTMGVKNHIQLRSVCAFLRLNYEFCFLCFTQNKGMLIFAVEVELKMHKEYVPISIKILWLMSSSHNIARYKYILNEATA